MREIKFRFWCPNKGLTSKPKMIQPEEWADLLIKGDGRIFVWTDIAENSGLSEVSSDWAIPMQYTGLKDKNGKEIYEGDYVRDGDMGDLWEVRWYQREAAFCPWNVRSQAWSAGNLRPFAGQMFWIKVGNIYENPEILKL